MLICVKEKCTRAWFPENFREKKFPALKLVLCYLRDPLDIKIPVDYHHPGTGFHDLLQLAAALFINTSIPIGRRHCDDARVRPIGGDFAQYRKKTCMRLTSIVDLKPFPLLFSQLLDTGDEVDVDLDEVVVMKWNYNIDDRLSILIDGVESLSMLCHRISIMNKLAHRLDDSVPRDSEFRFERIDRRKR